MLKRGTPIKLAETGETFLVRRMCLYQPRLGEGIVRAIVGEQLFAGDHYGPRECQKIDGVWTAGPASPIVRDERIHPDLDDFGAEFVISALDVVERAETTAPLAVWFGSDQDNEGRYQDTASVVFHTTADLYPDASFCSHLPGFAALEREGVNLWQTFGVARDNDRQMRGNPALVIKPHEIEFEYQIDTDNDVEFRLESRIVDGQWTHMTRVDATYKLSPNIIEALKQEALDDASLFAKLKKDFLFERSFPGLKDGNAFPNEIIRGDELVIMLFEPGAIRLGQPA